MSSDEQRSRQIVDVLTDAFRDLMEADARAFRRKFRAMAADPFAFFRGTACLFYADVVAVPDRWADERTGRVWIQGDLHAENFGTYMDGDGVLIFDVNDYDEAYLGPFTWDLRDHEWSLRLGTAHGPVHDALLTAQLQTRVGLLETMTVVEDYQRRFRESPGLRVLEDGEREAVVRAYRAYLDTLPGSEHLGSITYDLKDVVGASGFGIGSAGLQSYNLLVEGHTQALENDVVLSMKQGAVPAPGRVAPDEAAERDFEHQGHRTAVSQRTLQAHPDPWLGWTRMEGGPLDGVGFVVKELSPYEADLDWEALSEPDELEEVLEQLGRATAKVHCVSDVDSPDVPLVDFQTEDAIADVVSGAEDELVADVVAFGLEYGERARADHALFVDAFRTGRFEHVDPSEG